MDNKYIQFSKYINGGNCKYTIKKNNNAVYVYITDNNHEKSIYDIEKFFMFKDDICTFEYGCIKLDFSSKWQDFLNNTTSLEI